jgi:hypothetical protein
MPVVKWSFIAAVVLSLASCGALVVGPPAGPASIDALALFIVLGLPAALCWFAFAASAIAVWLKRR